VSVAQKKDATRRDNMHTKGDRWEDTDKWALRMGKILDAAKDMTTDEAVRYLEHGPEMVEIIESYHSSCAHKCQECSIDSCKTASLLKAMGRKLDK
jgi:hypothetical protein